MKYTSLRLLRAHLKRHSTYLMRLNVRCNPTILIFSRKPSVPRTYFDSKEYLGLKNVYVPSEHLFQANGAMEMPKYAPWRHDIDLQTLILHSMGFDLYYSYRQLPLDGRKIERQNEQSEMEPLKLQHLFMPLAFLAGGLSISFFVFLLLQIYNIYSFNILTRV